MTDAPLDVALQVRAEHAEGPIWDEASARLWWIDITGQRVHEFDPASGRDASWGVAGQPGAVFVAESGVPVVALPGRLARLDPASGRFATIVDVEADRPENRANDGKIDSRGRCWIGTMAYDKSPGQAGLFCVDAERRVRRVVDGLTISNGPAFDEARGRMYLADTALGIVDVFDLDGGDPVNRRRFADLGDSGGWPDGMTVDVDGHLWVAVGRTSSVHRYAPDGTLDGRVELPVTNPTSVTFGGTDGGDLYITTSWFDLEPDERPGQPLAGAIFVTRPGVTGPPMRRLAGV